MISPGGRQRFVWEGGSDFCTGGRSVDLCDSHITSRPEVKILQIDTAVLSIDCYCIRMNDLDIVVCVPPPWRAE